MNNLIGDRKEKSALDEMIEVAKEFNEECREEERKERIEEERRRRAGIIAKTEETIKNYSEDARTFLEKVNNIKKDISGLYYDGEKDFELIRITSVRSTASIAIANFLAGDKLKAAECFGDIAVNLGRDQGMIGRHEKLFTNLSEAYTADNAYMAIYCFLEGSSGDGKDILDEIEKRIHKINTRAHSYYTPGEKKEGCFLSNQSLMYIARTYAGQQLEAYYQHLKGLRQAHGMYDNYNDVMNTKTSLETTKATASMAFLACLYNDKEHAREILELLKKSCRTDSGLYKASHKDNAIYTEDNALVAIASFLSA